MTNATKSNKLQQNFDSLEPKHQQAIDLRLEGLAYKVIAKSLNLTEQHVRRWFMKGGTCHYAYQLKQKQRMKDWQEDFKKIDDKLKEIATEAVLAIKQNVRKGSLWAAFGVLDRVGFQPIQKLQPMTEPKVQIINYSYPQNGESKTIDGETETKEDTALQPWHPEEEILTTNNP
ncbi:hypothetical protein HYW42_00785 [Candidatus Daviesbacteria bacterium]|nr:hypothetical protein [Candidatus Daviesbacteria bacterium]